MFARCNSDDGHEHAGGEYALSRRKVFSWRHKDEYVSDSDTGLVFRVDDLTTAKLRRP